MRAKEFLIESEGGMLRRAEEATRGKRVSFKNNAGNVIDMIDAVIIPEVETELEPGELIAQLTAFAEANGIATADFKTLPATTGLTTPDNAGVAMALVFQDAATGKRVGWIALKAKRKPGAYPIFLQTKLFSDLTGYQQLSAKKGEEDKISGVQERASTNLKPVGIASTNSEIATDDIPSDVASVIAGRADLSQEIKDQVVQLLENVAAGRNSPVPGANKYAKSYEIDLGETAAPIALVKQRFLSGSWQQAEDSILGGAGGFSKIRGVEFPNDPAEKLYDSYLIIDDNNIVRVSSKDKKGGAKASISGMVDDITKYPERYEGMFDDEEMKKLYDVVLIIKNPDMDYVSQSNQWYRNGSIAGVLQLGVHTEIINRVQSDALLAIIDSDQQHVPPKQLKANGLNELLSYKGTDDDQRNDYRIGWHLLAGLAQGVANKINNNPLTDKFFRMCLERSNMIQVKTKLTVTKDTETVQGGAFFSNFEVIYPPVFTGKILMDPSSNYYATRRPVGKIGFAIK